MSELQIVQQLPTRNNEASNVELGVMNKLMLGSVCTKQQNWFSGIKNWVISGDVFFEGR